MQKKKNPDSNSKKSIEMVKTTLNSLKGIQRKGGKHMII